MTLKLLRHKSNLATLSNPLTASQLPWVSWRRERGRSALVAAVVIMTVRSGAVDGLCLWASSAVPCLS